MIHEGALMCIQDKDGILEDNYLNQAYKNEFYRVFVIA